MRALQREPLLLPVSAEKNFVLAVARSIDFHPLEKQNKKSFSGDRTQCVLPRISSFRRHSGRFRRLKNKLSIIVNHTYR